MPKTAATKSSAKSRTTVLKKDIKNSAEKRMANGEDVGPVKTKYEHKHKAPTTKAPPPPESK